MPLTDEEDRAEHLLRMDQMTVNVEKMRFDIQAEIDRREALQKWETRKFVVSALLAFAATLAAGVALGRFWLFHA
jgi:flagellar biosynthesis/type III secretory pathway M-ring protein FliF/YscJ